MEEGRKNPDYQKLKIIETFKKLKFDYQQVNRVKNMALDDDPIAERKILKDLDNEFLSKLEAQLTDLY
jgi:hypothetical protein